MAEPVTASEPRQNIYRILDQVLATGEPLEIERRGRRLRLIAQEPADRLARIQPLPSLIAGDPEELVALDWRHDPLHAGDGVATAPGGPWHNQDPFARVITATALAAGAVLATRDGFSRHHFPDATLWD